MNTRVARVTSPEEVMKYFAGARWRPAVGPSKFEKNITDDDFIIRLTPGKEVYDVRIEATDDPSDSKATEEPTDDPIAFISKFLRQDDHEDLSRISFDANFLARRIRKLAAQGPKVTEQVLRRAISLLEYRIPSRTAAELDLKGEAKKRGWEVTEEDGETKIDVSGVYSVTVTPAGISWDYQFEVAGTTEGTVHGTAQDPIIKYRKWYKDPGVVQALSEQQELRSTEQEEKAAIQDEQETVRPAKKPAPPSGNADTERAP